MRRGLLIGLVGYLPLLVWAADVTIDPAGLPRGSTSLMDLQAEVERLSAGRDTPHLVAGGGPASLTLSDADDLHQGLVGARDPFSYLSLFFPSAQDGNRRVVIVGPRAAAERARTLLDSRAEARDIELFTAETSDESAIVESEVALILALPGLGESAQRNLFTALRDAGLPTLALSDPTQVERGALLSLPGAVDEPTWLRRLALRIDDLQAGRPAAALDTWPTQGREWLNLATARRLGWAPDFDLLTQARLIDAVTDEPGGAGNDAAPGVLSLEQAVALALSDNVGLEIARHETETRMLDHDEALSRWRPNLYLEATGRQIDDNRAVSALGQSPERRATAGVTLEQLIFSEPALAAVAVTASLDRARRAELEVETLDLALETASEFLDALRLSAQVEVLRDDLELTQENLRQAERRIDAGAAGREERLRFASERAQARERLEDAIARRMQLGLALNRRLGLPGDTELVPQAPAVSTPEWLAGDARFAEWVRSPESLSRWQAALVDDALRSSQELHALAASREAANRELEARRRAFWVPEVGLQVRYDHELYRAGAGDRAPWESDSPVVQAGVAALDGVGVRLPETGEDEWSVGISARLPLYAGGRRSIDRERSARQLESVALRQEDARQGIETRLRAASVELVAAWRRIELRETSRDNAEQALALVESAWREGASDLVTLLDAQTTARQARLAEVESRWQFLQSLVHLQRALGLLPGPLSIEDRDRLLEHREGRS